MAELTRLAGGTLIEGRWYKDRTIQIDGYHFKGCRFDDCFLKYNTLDFKFTACAIVDTYFVPGEPGLLALRSFHVAFPNFDTIWPGLAPVRHPDGTVSIDGNWRTTD